MGKMTYDADEFETDWLGRIAGIEYMANPLPNLLYNDHFKKASRSLQMYKTDGKTYRGRKHGRSGMSLVGTVMILKAVVCSFRAVVAGIRRSPSSARRVVFSRVLTTAGQRIARRVPRVGAFSTSPARRFPAFRDATGAVCVVFIV